MGKKIDRMLNQLSQDQKQDDGQSQEYHEYSQNYQLVNDQTENQCDHNVRRFYDRTNRINQYLQQPSSFIKLQKPKKTTKRKKKIKDQDQISARDIIDIIVVILLVLILGVSLFRVVLQVQVQYKKQQTLNQQNHAGRNNIVPRFQKSKERNSQNQNQKVESQENETEDSDNNKVNQNQTFLITPQCQRYIDSLLEQKGSLYEFSIPYESFSIKSKVYTQKETMKTQISKQKYNEAIDLMELIHQVDGDGNINVQQNDCESQQKKRERLQKAVQEQTQRLNLNYQMDSYHLRQLPFCIVVNSYNNFMNGLIYRNIDSILQQNYTNYHVIYTDDYSNDSTGEKVKEYLLSNNIKKSKFLVRINQQKVGMMENIFNAIHYHCQQGQIAVMVDGDDSLIGTNVLSLLNAVYQKRKPAMIWSNFVSIFGNKKAGIGFSGDYSDKIKKDGSFRQIKVFFTSHLKTFFVDLFRKIKIQDLQSNDGKFFGGASDTAIMIPMVEMSNPHMNYLAQILYEYRYDTGQTGNFVNKIPQKQALKKIYSTSSYPALKDFTFIQKAIKNALQIFQKINTNSTQEKQIKVVNESSLNSVSLLKN